MGIPNPTTFTLAPAMAPAAPLMRMLGRYDRQKLEAFIEISIGLLDLIDPDPEAEEIGLEDAFISHDPRFADQVEDNEAGAWVEWTTMRGSQKRGPNLLMGHEDDEDDDPPEDDDSDRCGAGDDWMAGGNLNCSGLLYAGADMISEDDEHSHQLAETSIAAKDD
jgi:hypothetical protein